MFIVLALTSIGLGGCGVEVGARAVTLTKERSGRERVLKSKCERCPSLD